MGRLRKRFNWKARQVVPTDVDDSVTKKIKLDLDVQESQFDSSNALALPSEKRKTKKKPVATANNRILSKKKRKLLEKVVERKKKKEKRTKLLEALSEVQARPEELSLYRTIADVQTKGRRRVLAESKVDEEDITFVTDSVQVPGQKKISTLAGSNKKRKGVGGANGNIREKRKSSDGTVVGFEESSDSEELEEIDDTPASPEPEDQPMSTEKSDALSVVEEQISTPAQPLNITEKIIPTVPKAPSKPAVYVPVHRLPEVQESRLKLPILAEEQAIMEAIRENPIVVLAGETGSGKTTQVPQFLYEAGYALDGKRIGITEPRRVAAVSMSQRVAYEMNLGEDVSYQIRFEGNVTDKTKIKFMTDGVLLKEMQKNFLLDHYSVIIIDEAHERSIYTDILIGLLSRVVPLREKKGNPLKLVIMSATLRIEDFTENSHLFKNQPPVISVESRQFPVTIHFNKRTPLDNYLDEAYRKVCKIHRQLPDGGILVFLTGQQEVNWLVRKLRKTFPFPRNSRNSLGNHKKEEEESDVEEGNEAEKEMERALEAMHNVRKKKKKTTKKTRETEVKLPEINLDDYSLLPQDDTEADLVDNPLESDGPSEDEEEEAALKGCAALCKPMWVLPLFSLLPADKQQKVFQPPPKGSRLCVVATNVAETSLTIPDVKYVVDTGRVKTKFYDKVTGVSVFQVTWTSKASANQRAGRAGRMGPGHCYRLYSSAVFKDEFVAFSQPEMQRRPIDDLILQMKSMHIDRVVNFPFPTPPDPVQLQSAEKKLVLLGALEAPKKTLRMKEAKKKAWASKITPVGQVMAAFPVSPRFGKMLALSHQHALLPLTICMVAALSVPEVLLEAPIGGQEDGPKGKERRELRSKWALTRRAWAGVANSHLLGDPMVLLRAVGAAEYTGYTSEFCEANGLRYKAMVEIRKLRVQLTNEANLVLPQLNLCVDPKMPPPTDIQAKLLRQILLAGLPDQVAKKVNDDELKESDDKVKWKHAYRCSELEEPVFLHYTSVVKGNPPDWVVYQEVYETKKMYMRGVTAIEPEWLPIFAPTLCNMSKPLDDPPPRYDPEVGRVMCYMNVTYGRAAWQLPPVEMEYPEGPECCRWFARFLLEGSIFPKLAKYTHLLLALPVTMIRSWAKLQPRTEILLKSLLVKNVYCKDSLKRAWQEDPKYLFAAYLQWLPESVQNEAALHWPPL